MLSEEIRYRILKAIEANPCISQRELAAYLGVSLGKANYCIRELIKKGLVKIENFRTNPRKRAYAYCLTPRGMKEKAQITASFLQLKIHEYEQIKKEIDCLRLEVKRTEVAPDNL